MDAHAGSRPEEVDFSEVKGQLQVKRAIEVAVAGNHNLLFIGPVGSGKSVLAKRIATIIPPMTREEADETTEIHSICGLLGDKISLVCHRPFRSPHHTISDINLFGSPENQTPGETSIAHNGILFLDDLPEFKPSTLELLGKMIEGRRHIARTAMLPANFMLVTAMIPCPCSYFGDPARECRCSPGQVKQYRSRIPGQLLDMIDIQVETPAVTYRELSSNDPAECSAAIRERVAAARERQRERFASGKRINFNASMGHAEIKKFCSIGISQHLLDDRILKVARTIADLAGADVIAPEHISEAIQYRALARKPRGAEKKHENN